jgi:hypothetical protein
MSPVAEYRLTGLLELTGGLLFGLAAVVIDGVAGIVELLLAVAFVSTWMYLVAYRRFARRAVRRPAVAPATGGEPISHTRRRAALTVTGLVVLTACVALITHTPGLVGGIIAGNGVALLATSRWLRRWEQAHGRRLLREPRWRWSREGERGWGRGRGLMDPQDFYVLTPSESPR